MKTILVLGAGLVARPLLRYLLAHRDCRVVVATMDVPRARVLLGSHPRGSALELDAADEERTASLISSCDVVVSLLPAGLVPTIARLCVRFGKHLVSTSYVAPETAALDETAKRADVLLLCEIGLDPGIDHMSAVSVIDRLRELGAAVTHFQSCCGGLPAQNANANANANVNANVNANPWGYKFSWSPRGVLLAGRNAARYLRSAAVVEIPGPELFAHSWPYEVEGHGVFEIYPNRDSLEYVSRYGLDGIRGGMFRGTIRRPGWCATMKAAVDLGLLDTAEHEWPAGTTYAHVSARLLPASTAPLVERVADWIGTSADSELVSRLEWAGLLSDRPIPERRASPLDVLANRLAKLMAYRPGERDMVVLEHLLTVEHADGTRARIRSSLVETGEPWGDSAMARTVSLPAAIATRLILNGSIVARGVQIPIGREIYEPVLAELADCGVGMVERRTELFPGPFFS